MKWSHDYIQEMEFLYVIMIINNNNQAWHAMPFQYKSITTTNKHGEVWSFLKDKQSKKAFF
jgi:hypothetical protein